MDNPFHLTENEQKELEKIYIQIQVLQIEAVKFLRERGQEKGFIAEKLEDLKAQDGGLFIECSCKEDFYRQAKAGNGEMAYLCRNLFAADDNDSCGWVKGEPIKEPLKSPRYIWRSRDNTKILWGLGALDIFCSVCGRWIGRVTGNKPQQT